MGLEQGAVLTSMMSAPVLPIEFVAGSNGGSASLPTGNVSIAKPTGTIEGDLVLITGCTRNSYMTGMSGGSAWTELDSYKVLSDQTGTPATGNEEMRTWWKIAGDSEPANYTMAYSDNGSNGLAVQCLTFRNATSVRLYSAIGTQTCPNLVALEGEALVSHHGDVYNASDTTGVVQPSGMTLVNKQSTGASVNNAIAYQLGLPSGAIGSKVWAGGWNSYEFATTLLLG